MDFAEAFERAKAAHVIIDTCNQPGENYRTQHRCRQGCGPFGLVFAEDWDQHIIAAADSLLEESNAD